MLEACGIDASDGRVADVSAWTLPMWLAAATHSEAEHDFAAAFTAYHAALRLDPVDVTALSGLSRLAERSGDGEGAIDWARRAAQRLPDAVDLALHLAALLEAERRLEEALTVLERLPDDDASTCAARGSCLDLQGDTDAGMVWLRRAVALAPTSSGIRTAFAIGLWRRHAREEALTELEHAHALAPADMRARFVRAHLRLELGDFARGYADSEAFDAFYPPAYRHRRWRGEPIAGKTLLLYDQHGHGDTLQMVRYADVCAALGARVVLKVRDSMIPLLRGVRGVEACVGFADPEPLFDVQARLLDLPAILGHTVDTIPAALPYLSASPERVQRIARALAPIPRPWLGIAWRGNPRQKDGLIRSCRAQDLRPLMDAGFSLISLHHDATLEELATLGAHGLPDLDRDGAFLDTAALIINMDRVVSIDTSIAHLAGALGAKVWMLLPYWGDWRWLADRGDTPWYPGMRLFRQSRPHDWTPAIAAVRDALRSDRGTTVAS